MEQLKDKIKSLEAPEEFWQELKDLEDLEDGWDGGTELAIPDTTLYKSLSLIYEVANYCKTIGKAPVFPEMAPGFIGDVGLEYFKPEKQICIEIYPEPKRSPTIIKVVMDGDKIVEMEPYDKDDLLKLVSWFIE